jgi:hypothetical protein
LAGVARAGKEGHWDMDATLTAMALATIIEKAMRDLIDTIVIKITLVDYFVAHFKLGR